MTSNHRLEYTAGLALATTSLHALGIVFALVMQRAAVRPFIRPGLRGLRDGRRRLFRGATLMTPARRPDRRQRGSAWW
jgi:hypothetical protein